jgi:hypothetical protein
LNFSQFSIIKTLDPDQDSFEMLDPDPDPNESGSTKLVFTTKFPSILLLNARLFLTALL